MEEEAFTSEAAIVACDDESDGSGPITTPNLLGRVVIGADGSGYPVGATGGSNSTGVLTSANGSHIHGAAASVEGGHDHSGASAWRAFSRVLRRLVVI